VFRVEGSLSLPVRADTTQRLGRGEFRKPTADRDAFRRYVCHTLKRMSCQTPVIVGDRKPSGGGRGTPSRRQVTHVPYDPSFEMPDEGGADFMSRCNT
jgi:hypothetical protein